MQHGWESVGEWQREWMEWPGVDAWVGWMAVDATPDCRNVKRSGIRRLSLTRDMRHGRFGVAGAVCCLPGSCYFVCGVLCCGLDGMVCSVPVCLNKPCWARPGQAEQVRGQD